MLNRFNSTLRAVRLRERMRIPWWSTATASRSNRLLVLSAIVPILSSCAHPENCKPLPAELFDERINESVALLALTLSKGIAPDKAVYGRLENELQKIQSLQPDVAGIEYVSTHDGRTLHVTLERSAEIRWQLGFYDDLTCLNNKYHADSVATRGDGLIEVHFSPIYNLDELAHSYAALPGVKLAEPARTLFLDSTRTICLTRQGEQWHYVFQRHSESERKLYYFTSEAASQVQERGSWVIPDLAEDFDTQSPAWVAMYWNDNSCK